MNNNTLAKRLLEHAALLESKGENLYRVRAYRKAASAVKMSPRSLSELLAEGGREALEDMPGLGEHLAYTLEGLIRTGQFRTMGADAEPTDPRERLTSLPGVGPRLAVRMRDELGITTLDEAERAARDGRLQKVGIGPKRLRGLLEALEFRHREQEAPEKATSEPSVADLLAIDEQYRSLAQSRGPRLASWNVTPADEVPVLQTRRGEWTVRATFSMTALAFRLGLTRDWVVIRFSNGTNSGERTVVTETRNDLRGQRVVRGRERECQACWAS
ncbi:MAG: DNA-binding protein [Planctomycetes bacterium]|nr:DNA-binding protein [Planctomycetota bacterium]